MKKLIIIFIMLISHNIFAASPFTSGYVNTLGLESYEPNRQNFSSHKRSESFTFNIESDKDNLSKIICNDDNDKKPECSSRVEDCFKKYKSSNDNGSDKVDTKENKKFNHCISIVSGDYDPEYKNWTFFRFNNGSEAENNIHKDSVIGGIEGLFANDVQQIKFNAINYNLWFGGDLYLPFQLFLGTTASTGSSNIEKENNTSLLDPESGISINFPLIAVYQPNINSKFNGLCDFRKIMESKGSCTIGGDITFNYQELERESDNKKETTFGTALRAGLGVLFPVVNPISITNTSEEVGYFSLSYKFTGSYSNSDDPKLFFKPISDVNGNTVDFKNWIMSSEVIVKFSLDNQFSISGKYITPHNNGDYLEDSFSLVLGSAF